MIGEKIIIGEDFSKAAQELSNRLFPQIKKFKGKFIIALAGESGSGKTGISFALSKFLSEKGIKTVVIQQDDYTAYQPKEIASKRKKDLARVGLSEVQLALLEQNLQEIKAGKKEIEKPLVVVGENQIVSEAISLEGVKVVIVEGLYSFVLENIDKHILIDRTHLETKEARKLRGRDKQDELMERVLKIEHGIILLGKPKADILITKDFNLVKNNLRESKKKRTRGDFRK